MITVGVIRDGKTYLTQHLRKNDYWAEGEKNVEGEWIGLGAVRLGLQGKIAEKEFEALRQNRNPKTGEQLTRRLRENRVAFFDIQLSAPKDSSVVAIVGDDSRVRHAFAESVRVALAEMERFAAVRERRGAAVETEKFRITGNFVGGLFFHDASRDLDPQLHAHAVLANATWDEARKEWLALQPAEMLRASAYIRQVLYREFASRLRKLGYEPYDMNSNGFSIRGVEHLRERFSKRAAQVKKLAEIFSKEMGRKPTKREVEVLVKESRAKKLTQISTKEVRARQRAQLDQAEEKDLDRLVSNAKAAKHREQWSHGNVKMVLESAMRHTFERQSVARMGELLASALRLHPDFFRWRELREALTGHPDVVSRDGELTLRTIYREESEIVQRIRSGRNTRLSLGSPAVVLKTLTPSQQIAARSLSMSRDFLTVLVGDAGTGKTTVLRAIEFSHRSVGGDSFIALAPTTRAREALSQSGFSEADTVQRFLVSEVTHARAARRVVLVDEAGLLSTGQLNQLTEIVTRVGGRLLLVGDTKQHYSIDRGDALRHAIKHSGVPVVRLSEVLRQRSEEDRRFSRLLAAGKFANAFSFATRRGLISELPDDKVLFEMAAAHYADNRKRGVATLAVVPFWEEIERFNSEVRPALRARKLLGETETSRLSVKSLTWTNEEKCNWPQYQLGDHLLFARNTRQFRRGTSAEVIEICRDGLWVRGTDGHAAKITRGKCGTFDVGRPQQLPLAVGDRILIQARDDKAGFANGDFKDVAEVDPANSRVRFTDGSELPSDFTAWTYGHALTSYRSQGSTAEESILVLGEVAARALARRQFYVGNTRFRGSHRIFLSDREDILRRLSITDPGRELSTEFFSRQRIRHSQRFVPETLRRYSEHIRAAVQRAANHLRQSRSQTH